MFVITTLFLSLCLSLPTRHPLQKCHHFSTQVREPHGDSDCTSPACQGNAHRVDGAAVVSSTAYDDVYLIIPRPKPAAPKPGGDIMLLVRIHATAINPVDYKLPAMIGGKLTGLDFAGVRGDSSCGL